MELNELSIGKPGHVQQKETVGRSLQETLELERYRISSVIRQVFFPSKTIPKI